ncbi:hypothetical protein TSOC_007979 [Tetrabaena socialis]|uniref:Uncharacterized protein n=1 Tax=Tetrabaena socialis TaxID=47790 RepID=A0A2J7ZZQ8_9CHLO|nr:hypothetical protein TSOC_007979 [Tetrabaena socialis]|eukprot:PNH05736.1 hypothetical protein TSOC_007979 [Tetrabaena socialis]
MGTDVDWDRQVSGQHFAAKLHGVTTVLYPLTVIKTKQMTLPGISAGLKTRIQVSYKQDGATPSFRDVARQILRDDGPSGFLRGAAPRMVNAALWGTCMVTVYEHLKRICAKDEDQVGGS